LSDKCEACEGKGYFSKADGSKDQPCRWCSASGWRERDHASVWNPSPWGGTAVNKKDFSELKDGAWFRALRSGKIMPGRAMPPLMKVSGERFLWDEKGDGEWAVYDVSELEKLRHSCFKSFGPDKHYWNRVGKTLKNVLSELGLADLKKGKSSGGGTDRWDLL
jgi:hypothetical protein